MLSSSLVIRPEHEAVTASGHQADDTVLPASNYTNANVAYTLLTTARDYDTFIHRALLDGEGLTTASRNLMFTASGSAKRATHPSSADPYLEWGLGIGLQRNEKGTAIWHWGDNGPFKAFFIAFPDCGESVVIFTNNQNGLYLLRADHEDVPGRADLPRHQVGAGLITPVALPFSSATGEAGRSRLGRATRRSELNI